MRQDSRFQKTHFIFCDSHGLQLLFGDVLDIQPLKDIMARIQAVAAYFRNAPLQLARLRDHQAELYKGKTYGFALAVVTRWGTQYAVVRSLLRSEAALNAFARDPKATVKDSEERLRLKNIKAELRDLTFWRDVKFLEDILKPIHKQQVKSESLAHHLGGVFRGWNCCKWGPFSLLYKHAS